MADIKQVTIGETTYDINDVTARAAVTAIPPMVILSYGHSTWQDFLTAYSTNTVIYCRASSNSNPATGSQTRLAFMAYVNDATTPTQVEFQYYRSVNTHTISQQGDQVFVYLLKNTGVWSVTTREASAKIVAGTGLSSAYSNNTLTLSNDGVLKISESTVTLPAASWDASTHVITVTVSGVTANTDQEILPLLATSSANITNNENLIAAGIMDYGQAEDSISLYAKTVPTTDLQVRVIIYG